MALSCRRHRAVEGEGPPVAVRQLRNTYAPSSSAPTGHQTSHASLFVVAIGRMPNATRKGGALVLAVACALFVCHSLVLPRTQRGIGLRHTQPSQLAEQPAVDSRVAAKSPSESCALHQLGNTTYVLHAPRDGPIGALFLFHGCSHGAADFCAPAAVGCAKCRALPAELDWVRQGLIRKMAVLAVSSRDRRSGCWHGDRDVQAVLDVAAHVGVGRLPFVSMGASSGGSFAMRFAAAHTNRSNAQCTGVISQVAAPLVPTALARSRIVWSVMDRDKRTLRAAQVAQRGAKQKHVSTMLVKHSPRRVTAEFLSGFSVPAKASAAVHAALKEHSLLDEEGYLRADPRHSQWRRVVAPVLAREDWRDSLLADKSAMSEALNIAYGMHELTDEHAAEMLDFVLTSRDLSV